MGEPTSFDLATIREIKRRNGEVLMSSLRKFERPVLLNDIVHDIAISQKMEEGAIYKPVKAILKKGIEYGFIYRHGTKYSLLPFTIGNASQRRHAIEKPVESAAQLAPPRVSKEKTDIGDSNPVSRRRKEPRWRNDSADSDHEVRDSRISVYERCSDLLHGDESAISRSPRAVAKEVLSQESSVDYECATKTKNMESSSNQCSETKEVRGSRSRHICEPNRIPARNVSNTRAPLNVGNAYQTVATKMRPGTYTRTARDAGASLKGRTLYNMRPEGTYRTISTNKPPILQRQRAMSKLGNRSETRQGRRLGVYSVVPKPIAKSPKKRLPKSPSTTVCRRENMSLAEDIVNILNCHSSMKFEAQGGNRANHGESPAKVRKVTSPTAMNVARLRSGSAHSSSKLAINRPARILTLPFPIKHRGGTKVKPLVAENSATRRVSKSRESRGSQRQLSPPRIKRKGENVARKQPLFRTI